MQRFGFMILILVWFPSIAFGMDTLRVSECTYHQRSPGMVQGVPIFMDLWRQGCTTISFLQYADNAQVYFQYSPCSSYNLKTWASGTVPAGAQELSSYYQKSWGRWKQTERFQFQEDEFWVGRGGGGGVKGTTLWCGEWERPAQFPGTIQQATPSSPQKSTPALTPVPSPSWSPEEMRGASDQRAAQQKASSPASHRTPVMRHREVHLPEFHPDYRQLIIFLTVFGCFLVGFSALIFMSWNAPDLPALREELERLHIKKVESDNWSTEWSEHELASLPDGSVDTTRILEQWRTKSSAPTYRQLQRKATFAAKHFDEAYEEVYDMLVKENEEDIKRWELITGKERPPWGILQPKKKRLSDTRPPSRVRRWLSRFTRPL